MRGGVGEFELGFAGKVFEDEFRAGEKKASEDHGLEKGALAGSADVDEEEVKMQEFPGIDEDSETAEVQCGVDFKGVGVDGGFVGTAETITQESSMR